MTKCCLVLVFAVAAVGCKKKDDGCDSARQVAVDNISPALGAAVTADTNFSTPATSARRMLLEEWATKVKVDKPFTLPATPPDGVSDLYAKVAAYQAACHVK